MADPAFMQKLFIEEAVTLVLSLAYEIRQRGENFTKVTTFAKSIPCMYLTERSVEKVQGMFASLPWQDSANFAGRKHVLSRFETRLRKIGMIATKPQGVQMAAGTGPGAVEHDVHAQCHWRQRLPDLPQPFVRCRAQVPLAERAPQPAEPCV